MNDYVFTLNRSTFSKLAGLKSSFVAFSGDGTGRNNPDAAGAANQGPILPVAITSWTVRVAAG